VGSVVGRIHGGEKGVVFEDICEVSKRAACGTAFDLVECLENGFVIKG
jgi:hypothetical protein